ncbi:uncharacterized protein BT62DRAFT_1012794 [Guyanagaster necrorhizus]|uniref:Uncharacterized protein n=1 Tax=Guyanagaster necrorhizus TaxID=856835 RepID=A0A9P8AM46_9AGAR|nr:uncharacterized protein BT62DRAFT_1012794 [Guyanagaster necrorhizus MCA 3950]KAG7440301.1 hypothetical protein BT62DRAFT_1012794 [Guyanagaster necrorhizus MCA 3950]
MYLNIFLQASEESPSLVSQGGKLATFFRAIIHGKLSQPPPVELVDHCRLFSQQNKEDGEKANAEEMTPPESGELHAKPAESPLGQVPVTASPGKAVQVDALIHRIRQFSYLLVFILHEPKGNKGTASVFGTALCKNLETSLKDYAVTAEALIKGLKMAVDLGQWRNRNGIRAQLDFAKNKWEFIQGMMEVLLAQTHSKTMTEVILNAFSSSQTMHMPTLASLDDEDASLLLSDGIVPSYYS